MICRKMPVIGVTAVTPACGGIPIATRGSGLTSTGFGCTESACEITCTSNDFGLPRPKSAWRRLSKHRLRVHAPARTCQGKSLKPFKKPDYKGGNRFEKNGKNQVLA